MIRCFLPYSEYTNLWATMESMVARTLLTVVPFSPVADAMRAPKESAIKECESIMMLWDGESESDILQMVEKVTFINPHGEIIIMRLHEAWCQALLFHRRRNTDFQLQAPWKSLRHKIQQNKGLNFFNLKTCEFEACRRYPCHGARSV